MSTFEAKRVSRSYTQKILATPGRIFPLLCPVREKEWLDGWDPEMVYSESGLAETGCIFKTKRHWDAETIWVVTRHEPGDFRVEFAMVTPGSLVGQLCISLDKNTDDTTSSHITYTFTALDERGGEFVDGYTEDEFNRRIEWWEKSLNHFLQTGQMLKSSGR